MNRARPETEQLKCLATESSWSAELSSGSQPAGGPTWTALPIFVHGTNCEGSVVPCFSPLSLTGAQQACTSQAVRFARQATVSVPLPTHAAQPPLFAPLHTPPLFPPLRLPGRSVVRCFPNCSMWAPSKRATSQTAFHAVVSGSPETQSPLHAALPPFSVQRHQLSAASPSSPHGRPASVLLLQPSALIDSLLHAALPPFSARSTAVWRSGQRGGPITRRSPRSIRVTATFSQFPSLEHRTLAEVRRCRQLSAASLSAPQRAPSKRATSRNSILPFNWAPLGVPR